MSASIPSERVGQMRERLAAIEPSPKALSVRELVAELYPDLLDARIRGVDWEQAAADLSEVAGHSISPNTLKAYYAAEAKVRDAQAQDGGTK